MVIKLDVRKIFTGSTVNIDAESSQNEGLVFFLHQCSLYPRLRKTLSWSRTWLRQLTMYKTLACSSIKKWVSASIMREPHRRAFFTFVRSDACLDALWLRRSSQP